MQISCGVVIEKEKDVEKICPELAAETVTIVNPDDMASVDAVLIMCARHARELESGKSLIFKSEKTGERIAVKYAKEESNVT